jgi:hypothetical protein
MMSSASPDPILWSDRSENRYAALFRSAAIGELPVVNIGDHAGARTAAGSSKSRTDDVIGVSSHENVHLVGWVTNTL